MGILHFVGLTKDRCKRFRYRSDSEEAFRFVDFIPTFRHDLRGIRASARHPTFELRGDGFLPENLYRVNFNERCRDSWIDRSGEFFSTFKDVWLLVEVRRTATCRSEVATCRSLGHSDVRCLEILVI